MCASIKELISLSPRCEILLKFSLANNFRSKGMFYRNKNRFCILHIYKFLSICLLACVHLCCGILKHLTHPYFAIEYINSFYICYFCTLCLYHCVACRWWITQQLWLLLRFSRQPEGWRWRCACVYASHQLNLLFAWHMCVKTYPSTISFTRCLYRPPSPPFHTHSPEPTDRLKI